MDSLVKSFIVNEILSSNRLLWCVTVTGAELHATGILSFVLFDQFIIWRKMQIHSMAERNSDAICDGGFVNFSTVENSVRALFRFSLKMVEKKDCLSDIDRASLYEFDNQYEVLICAIFFLFFCIFFLKMWLLNFVSNVPSVYQ